MSSERASETLAEVVKVSVLLRFAPGPLKQHLQLRNADWNGKVGQYAKVRASIEQYLQTQKQWGIDNSGPAPMDVDAITKGKGKGKDWNPKGKGKDWNPKFL